MIRISPNMAAKLYEPLMEFSENPIEGVTLEEAYQVFGRLGLRGSFSGGQQTRTPCILSDDRNPFSGRRHGDLHRSPHAHKDLP